ncbi:MULTISPECIES: enoyl-CoA hydratase/isomerase family protein [Cupriavidus]|uniref:3-hydroxyisobutyryl-CoA hydrolase n=1 Tax=Cupriavidus pinatubonensis (strain JMP 134 / LMG 1197) TaxID=264198 RepID=Q46TC0_CUPPJ|nr:MULTISPECIES: enoyl-CoA hydratase/isomerase family protein [Cupriavidus]TPQ38792.1 enoyl-CoA hydratase/isomerase family protein [Cupriavidus pinatubonensis]
MRLTPEIAPGSSLADTEPEVLFQVINRVGLVTLNRPRQLNALSYPMIVALSGQLEAWAGRDDIEAVVLRGAGPKAFCAGGDIRALYDSHRDGTPLQRQFFIDEYQLDYRLHRYPKPVVALMDGIVMGGGMGLSQAAHLRVVTERSRVAMPETGIGLVPDVGASHFLSKMPVQLALYLGLTGVTIGAEDALLCGLADVAVNSVTLAALDDALAGIRWSGQPLDDVRRALVGEPICSAADAPLLEVLPALLRHFPADAGLPEIIASLSCQDDPRYAEWATRTAEALRKRSPLAACATRELLLRGRRLDLADCFRMELAVVVQSFARGDFIEGVRALIVDKDNMPQWRIGSYDAVDAAAVEALFAHWWQPGADPLHMLG